MVSVVVGVYSLLTACLFSPLVAAIPACSISPVLVLVGLAMLGEAKEIQWWNMQDALPAFLCAVFQPFTYSVANGIYVGIGTSVVLFFTTGTFLKYLPGRKHEAEGTNGDQRSTPLLPPEEDGSAQAAGPKLGLGEQEAAAPGAEGASRVSVSRVGRAARLEATDLLVFLAARFGLDQEEVKQVVKQRILGGARDLEGHFFGGVGGFETAQAAEQLRSINPHHAPRLAAKARRARAAVAARQEREREQH